MLALVRSSVAAKVFRVHDQDPRTSLSWQRGEAERFVSPLGGEIVAEYFDIGQSRSLPWARREQASQVLEALKRPKRGWDGLVMGEATWCWYGNQFSLTWPKFDRYSVTLWIPQPWWRLLTRRTRPTT